MNEEPTGLLSIGEFARRSSLSMSALRFCGDCGVLVPARVDAASGYRYYSEDQLREAELIRQLRALEVPVAEVQSFLAVDPADAEVLLDQHWSRIRKRFESSRRALGAAKTLLRSREIAMSATTTLDGTDLASAVRQVLPAAGPCGEDRHFPAAVLLQLREDGLRLAATDGHRLSVRDLPTRTVELSRTVISAQDAERLASLVEDAGPVTLTAGHNLALELNTEIVTLPMASDHYPDYEAVLGRCGESAKLCGATWG